MKDVLVRSEQETLQSSRVGLQDLYQVAPPGGLGLQPSDGPLDLRLVRPLIQHHQELTGHAPSRLKTESHR